MKIEEFTKPAVEINEDAVYACEKFGFVLDGATGLLKENISPCKSDAQWFTLEVKKEFIKLLPNENLNLDEIVKQTILIVNQRYNSFDGAEFVKSRPSSGMALYRVKDDYIEYMILGDCSLLVRDFENNISHLKLDDLPRLDAINIAKMVKKAKENHISVIEARKLINDDLVATRLTQNTDKGYYILSDDLSAVDNALKGKIALNKVKQIVGLSDGFSQIFDTFSISTKEQLVNRLAKGDKITDLYTTLWNNQELDKNCDEHPRFKIRDDASLINIEF